MFVVSLGMVCFEACTWVQSRFSDTRFAIKEGCFPGLWFAAYHTIFVVSSSGLCNKMLLFVQSFFQIKGTWPATFLAALIPDVPDKLLDQPLSICQLPLKDLQHFFPK